MTTQKDFEKSQIIFGSIEAETAAHSFLYYHFYNSSQIESMHDFMSHDSYLPQKVLVNFLNYSSMEMQNTWQLWQSIFHMAAKKCYIKFFGFIIFKYCLQTSTSVKQGVI